MSVLCGDILRETRERKGYDMAYVTRRLRIRPDILQSIENSDFPSMPPRGYARNMVNAYARFLGLNPTEIVEMFLREYSAYKISKTYSAAVNDGFVMSGFQKRPRLGRHNTKEEIHHNYRDDYFSNQEAVHDRFSRNSQEGRSRQRQRHLFDDRTPYSHDGYGVRVSDSASKRESSEGNGFLFHHSSYPSASSSSSSSSFKTQGKRRERSVRVGETPMSYSAPFLPAFFKSRFFIGALLAIVLIIIIISIVMVATSSSHAANNDVSTLPVSGINDMTGISEQSVSQDAQVEVAPISARVNYSVASGESCYVEIYTDGKRTAAQLIYGPKSENVEVSTVWTITTWSPGTIKVFVDGVEVKLEPNEEYSGMYAYTVDFEKILEEWDRTHNTNVSQRKAAVAGATNAAKRDRTLLIEDDEDEKSKAEQMAQQEN